MAERRENNLKSFRLYLNTWVYSKVLLLFVLARWGADLIPEVYFSRLRKSALNNRVLQHNLWQVLQVTTEYYGKKGSYRRLQTFTFLKNFGKILEISFVGARKVLTVCQNHRLAGTIEELCVQKDLKMTLMQVNLAEVTVLVTLVHVTVFVMFDWTFCAWWQKNSETTSSFSDTLQMRYYRTLTMIIKRMSLH